MKPASKTTLFWLVLVTFVKQLVSFPQQNESFFLKLKTEKQRKRQRRSLVLSERGAGLEMVSGDIRGERNGREGQANGALERGDINEWKRARKMKPLVGLNSDMENTQRERERESKAESIKSF